MAGDSGSVPAMRKIAVILEKGDGIEANIEEAMKYYKMAQNFNDYDEEEKEEEFIDEQVLLIIINICGNFLFYIYI